MNKLNIWHELARKVLKSKFDKGSSSLTMLLNTNIIVKVNYCFFISQMFFEVISLGTRRMWELDETINLLSEKANCFDATAIKQAHHKFKQPLE